MAGVGNGTRCWGCGQRQGLVCAPITNCCRRPWQPGLSFLLSTGWGKFSHPQQKGFSTWGFDREITGRVCV